MRAARIIVLVVLVSLSVGSIAQAAFPGQNGKIAFYKGSEPPGTSWALWTINSDGSGQAQLTHLAPGMFAWRPQWSPDGTKILFEGDAENTGCSGGGGVCKPEIYVVNADGSGIQRLTNLENPNFKFPTWSPDGTKIAFSLGEINVMNADGTNMHSLGVSGGDPTWSPDGTRIAYAADRIMVMNADGTGSMPVSTSTRARHPDWSPDGTRIAFQSDVDTPCIGGPCDPEVYVVNADGTGEANITNTENNVRDSHPAWSPDGTRIAFNRWPVGVRGTDVYAMDPDGSDIVMITNEAGLEPTWQPLQPGYPRPKGATPLRASLVPAYIVCAAPNRTHGPPLAFASCNPPQERSGVLTVGTPDANGSPADMAGFVRMQVIAGDPATPGDQADVAVEASVTDVRCGAISAACPGGPGSDYIGKLLATPSALRITDRLNTPPGPDGVPGTGDGQLQVPFDCTPTANPAIGSACTLSTTIDALLPGAVREGKRAIWELGQMHVRDAGPNGTGYESPACPPTCGDGDETLFLRQGVFVP